MKYLFMGAAVAALIVVDACAQADPDTYKHMGGAYGRSDGLFVDSNYDTYLMVNGTSQFKIESDGSEITLSDATNNERISNATDDLVCLEGAGGTSDEDICFDVDGTNVIDITSTTGATEFRMAAMELDALNLKTDKVAISNAELLALRATNKTLVAAQGANTVIVPVSVLFFLDYGSAQCTESADNLALNYVDAAGLTACTAFETTGSWVVAAADAYGYYECDNLITGSVAQVVNTALTLDNNGDGELGDCTGSTATAWITYRVVDVS